MPGSSNGTGSRTQWLIDLENVGRKWRGAMDAAAPGDVLHLFFSDKSTKIGIDELGTASARGVEFRFHGCENGLPNAMDFQIMCALGMLASESPGDGYILFTADKGFTSVLGYMRARGIDVRCMPCAPAQNPKAPPQPGKKKPVPAVKNEYLALLKDAGTAEADAAVMADILYDTMSRPANRRKLACRNRMLKHWGNSDGSLMYQALKDLIHKIANEGPYPEKEPAKPAVQASVKTVMAAMSEIRGWSATEKFAGKLCEMIKASNRTAHPRQSLKDKLVQHYKNEKNADKAFRALERFLAEQPEKED